MLRLNYDGFQRVIKPVAVVGCMVMGLISMSVSASETPNNQTLITNVNGYSLNTNGELVTFSELLISDDRILAVGQDLNVTVDTLNIDGQGKTLLPGLIDAHGHMLGLGQNLLEADLRGTTSEQEAIKRVTSFVAKASMNTEQWVVGRGWNQVLWDKPEFPTKTTLDAVLPNRPVMLSRIDSHAIWVNSKALALAGITAETTSPAGGEIVKDAQGQPTGILIDNAMNLVEALLPEPDAETLSAQLDAATQHLLSVGITSMHDAGIPHSVYHFYQDQAKANNLGVRIYAMIAATDPQLATMLARGHITDPLGMLNIRSVKVYGDGALGSRGAALLAPYSDAPDKHGLLVTPQEQLPQVFRTILGADFQLNYHAIGDRANRLALQQFAQTFTEFPENIERHRVEHAQVIAVEDIPLFKQYGIIPSMQPTHATSDMNMAEDRLGATRLKGAYAWQTFLQQGSRIAFGSDFPVELANPFHGLHAAVTRQNAQQQPANGWVAEQRVTLAQAFRGFTLDAAYAGFQDDQIGTLEVGKKADFIIIDRDIFTISPHLIRDTQVLQTWVNGQQRF
jgi:predicted amidohydrolase YtcJ